MSRLNVANFRHPDGTADNINLDSSGRVLVGTSTAGAFSNRRVSIATSSGTTALELRSATDGDSRIVFTDSTDSGDAGSYKGQISYDQSSDFMSFNTNGNNERMRLDSSGNLQFNSGYGSVATAYGVRAWINFDGTLGTIGTGRANGNMDAVTDNGTGDYTVNFTNDMPDANYGVMHTSGIYGVEWGLHLRHGSTAPTASAYRWHNVDVTGAVKDIGLVCIAFVR